MMLALRERGIGSQVHYIPVPYQPYYRQKGLAQGSWPHAEHYYREALTIPLYFGMSDADVATVIAGVTDLVSGAQRRALSASG
jgi:dTDP-4-amino-4,6-dideoxygalactose transaminase